MKPAEARRLAESFDDAVLAAAVEALAEEQEPPMDVAGADAGEKLTHCLLAQKIRARMAAGEALKDAYRAVMGDVRSVMANSD